MKNPTPQQVAMRRAFAASKRIPNAPGPVRKARVHAWCEFVKEAMGQPEKENPPRGGDYAEHRGDGRATKNLSTAINGDEAGFSNS